LKPKKCAVAAMMSVFFTDPRRELSWTIHVLVNSLKIINIFCFGMGLAFIALPKRSVTGLGNRKIDTYRI
jgi:hypothetical protein